MYIIVTIDCMHASLVLFFLHMHYNNNNYAQGPWQLVFTKLVLYNVMAHVLLEVEIFRAVVIYLL